MSRSNEPVWVRAHVSVRAGKQPDQRCFDWHSVNDNQRPAADLTASSRTTPVAGHDRCLAQRFRPRWSPKAQPMLDLSVDADPSVVIQILPAPIAQVIDSEFEQLYQTSAVCFQIGFFQKNPQKLALIIEPCRLVIRFGQRPFLTAICEGDFRSGAPIRVPQWPLCTFSWRRQPATIDREFPQVVRALPQWRAGIVAANIGQSMQQQSPDR